MSEINKIKPEDEQKTADSSGKTKRKKRGFRDTFPMVLMILAFVVGMGLIAYPTFADWWNSYRASRAVASYDAQVNSLAQTDYTDLLEEASQYNIDLLQQPSRYHPSDTFHERYEELLNVNGNGLMGTITIPKIRIKLPFYHGTDDSVLQIAAGHIEGTSLPVGGDSTHAVLSGHRGLPSAKLFTDLDQLVIGDYFVIKVLNEQFVYEINDISVVEPEDVDKLDIVPGEDLVTLVTCTPYGINTHRLLITGHRIEGLPDDYVEVNMNAMLVDTRKASILAGAAVGGIFLIVLLFKPKRKKKKDEKQD